MAVDSAQTDAVSVIYIDGDTPAELLETAARWAAENDGAFAIEQLMVRKQSRAQGATGIAGRRLNPDILERSVAKNFAIGDAIQSNAAG